MKSILGYGILMGVLCSSSPLSAGGFDQQLFDSSLRRVESPVPNQELHVLEPVIKSTCDSPNSTKICIVWKVILPSLPDTEALLATTEAALNQWKNAPGVNLEFSQQAPSSDPQWPYRPLLDGSGQPTGNFEVDERGEKILEGPFLISFYPPSDLQFEANEIYRVIQFVRPSLERGEAEVLWAGLFFNPGLRRGQDYQPIRALLQGIGQVLGLAASTVTGSVMHPGFVKGQNNASLSVDDQLWIANRYPSESFLSSRGQLMGMIYDGEAGDAKKPLVGARVELVNKTKAADFSRSFNRSLVSATTVSGADGSWTIQGIMQGEYIAFLSPLPADTYVSDAISFFRATNSFQAEFYDGTNESNKEAAVNYSPRLLEIAAALGVERGQRTDPVWIISNTTSQSASELRAPGSNRETSVALNISRNFETENAEEEGPLAKAGGGCSIAAQNDRGHPIVMMVAVFLSLLALRRRVFQMERPRL